MAEEQKPQKPRYEVKQTRSGHRVWDNEQNEWRGNTFEDEGTARQVARNLTKGK